MATQRLTDRFTVCLTPQERRQLDALARRSGLSLSETARAVICDVLDRKAPVRQPLKGSKPRVRKRAVAA